MRVTLGIPSLGKTQMIAPEKREELIRKWVRSTPAERKQLCTENELHESAFRRWRAEGHWPKDLTTPQMTLPTAALAVAPRDTKGNPYSVEERLVIKAEHARAQSQGLAAVKAFTKKWGRNVHSFLYDSVEKLAATRPMPSEAFKKAAVERIEAILTADPTRKVQEIVAQVIKEAGHSMHWTSYYTWRKIYGKAAQRQPPEPKKQPPKAAKKKTTAERRSEEEKLAIVAQVDALRAGGMEMEKAVLKAGIDRSSYYAWKAGRQLSKGGRPQKADLVVAANRALHKANGATPAAMGSPVVPMIKEFFRRLQTMGVAVREIKTHDDGRMSVVVVHTETIEV